MDIEFKNLSDKFEVIEYVVRDAKLDYVEDESGHVAKHLQARLLVKEFDDDCVNFSLSYYSDDNEFLGLDHAESVYVTASKDRSIPISIPLDIPTRASRGVVRFTFNDDVESVNGFYGNLMKVGAGLAVAWFGLSLYRSISQTFGG